MAVVLPCCFWCVLAVIDAKFLQLAIDVSRGLQNKRCGAASARLCTAVAKKL